MLEKKEKQDNKKEYKEFRELLKKGIGLRTQADFAEAIGITRQRLNMFLRSETISRPSAELLRTMAKNMTGVTYRELMESCGYSTLNINELADAIASDFELCFMDKDQGIAYPVTHMTFTEMCDTFCMLYCPAEVDEMKFKVRAEKDNTNKDYPDADKMITIDIIWNDQDYDCRTRCNLYYAITKSGAKVMIGVKIEKTKEGATAMIEKKRAKGMKEKRLLAAIFGAEDSKLYQTFDTGVGFPYKETPKKFKEFLSSHRGSFCTNEVRCELWRKIIVDNEDPDEACKKFAEEHKGDTDEELYIWATGDIVAAIMSAELKDCPYMINNYVVFRAEDERIPEDERDSFVMTVSDVKDSDDRDKLMKYIYFYAHELGISHFGRCHYRYLAEVNDVEWNETEEYGKLLS